MPLRQRNKSNDNSYLVQYLVDGIFQVRHSGLIQVEDEVSVLYCICFTIFVVFDGSWLFKLKT